MKPVLVLQHLSADGPAYLGRWLADREVPVDVRNTEGGDTYPATLAEYGALAILGGEMSANDPLPSLRQAESLFLEAVRRGIPTLGHCLGGQLMARALGARVADSIAPEVGFHEIRLIAGDESAAWFGEAPALPVYHWHYEAFELPRGAQWLATSEACRHQAFSLGPHLAMQFHIELDVEKLERWSRDEGARYRQAQALHPTVHGGQRMRRDAAAMLDAHQRLAALARGFGAPLTAPCARSERPVALGSPPALHHDHFIMQNSIEPHRNNSSSYGSDAFQIMKDKSKYLIHKVSFSCLI